MNRLPNWLAVLIGVASILVTSPLLAQTLKRELAIGTQLGHPDGVALRGINDRVDISFSVPETWTLKGAPILQFNLVPSKPLLLEASSLTIELDGNPLWTRTYQDIGDATMTVPLPLRNPTGFHTVSLAAYQRSKLPCETDDQAGLWARIPAEGLIRLEYIPKPPLLDLARWPLPFVDDKDTEVPSITLILSTSPDATELRAAGILAAHLSRQASWRPLRITSFRGRPANLPSGNLIVLAKGEDRSRMFQWISVAPSLERAVDSTHPPKVGTLVVGARRNEGMSTVLLLLAEDSKGLLNLAGVLSNTSSNKLTSGTVQRVENFTAPAPLDERSWSRTAPTSTAFSLSSIGLSDQQARGHRGGTIAFTLDLVPDDGIKYEGGSFDVVYSYSARVDPSQSRLDVSVGGVPIGGTALADENGQTRQHLKVAIPPGRLAPSTRIDVQFHLVPTGDIKCATGASPGQWGTLHAESTLTLPRYRIPLGPDLGLLRFGAYPFGIRADLSTTTFVLPASPSDLAIQRYLWLAAELGRLVRSDRVDFDLALGDLGDTKPTATNTIVVADTVDTDFAKKLGLDSLIELRTNNENVVGTFGKQGETTAGSDPNMAFFEVVATSKTTSALVLTGGPAPMFEWVGTCDAKPSLLTQLRGLVARVKGCDAAEVIPALHPEQPVSQPPKGETARPAGKAAEWVYRSYWWVFGGTAAFLLLLVLLRTVVFPRQRRVSERKGKD